MQRCALIRPAVMVLLIVISGLGSFIYAQNNPYKIKDSLYELYELGYNNISNEKCLIYADSLYRQSARDNDKKAQCLGAVLRVRYATRRNNLADVQREAEFARKVARRNGFDRYYYYAYQVEIVWLLNHDKSLAAIKKCDEMKAEAKAENSHYGIFNCFRIYGNIYYTRRNYREALNYFTKALEYQQKYLPEQTSSESYFSIATCYLTRESELLTGLDYAHKATESAKVGTTKLKNMELESNFLFKLGRYDEFVALYNKIMAIYEKEKYSTDLYYTFMSTYKAVLDKDEAKALKFIKLLPNEIDHYTQKALLYKRLGDFKKAYYYEVRRQIANDSLMALIQTSDLAEMSARLDNEQLHRDNLQLQLMNSHLKLQQMQQQVDLEHSQAINNQLALNNRNLELNKLRTQNQIQRINAERQKLTTERHLQIIKQEQTKSRYQKLIGVIVIGVMLTMLILLFIYIERRRKVTKMLRKQNTELTEARLKTEKALNKAKESERLKTLFLQNMSHEIRTPLNSIVGFSQILADENADLSHDDRTEFSKLIINNSELLTTLVNDILTVSELESKLEMHIDEVRCNELCRESLITVEHRCPQGVALRFSSEVPDSFTINADGMRIKQVLINLLTNAEKFTSQGEINLHVSLTEVPNHITFAVSDTGRGIPADKSEAIFERFNKLDSFVQGTGLGLNICRIIADQMHGTVNVDTTYTAGARLVFSIPL